MQGEADEVRWGPGGAEALGTAGPGTRAPWRPWTTRGSSSPSLRMTTGTGTESPELELSPPVQTLWRRKERGWDITDMSFVENYS